jgi:CDP-diacylglycerol--serine O-phosphatidyltransferase
MDLNRNAIFPNLLTVGNGICGFSALILVSKMPDATPQEGLSAQHITAFASAAWLVLLGMVFDVFDGKVARMAGASSNLGAQLDSLCDLVTFGLVPAVMILRLAELTFTSPVWWERAVWMFSLAYFLGALLRLARFTAEQDFDESAHLAFKGLPTPAAAGCIASLVLFYTYILTFEAKELQWLSAFIPTETIQRSVQYIPLVLPVLGLLLGYTMVSNRLHFDHVGSWIFSKKRSFDFFVYLIFGGLLVGILPEPVLPLLFLGYLVYAPSRLVYRHFFASREVTRRKPESLDA